MNDSIQAKPTEYAGVHFKSRLEARFAEWLDTIPTKWEYEPVWEWGSYRPDFLISDLHLYVEIKPKAKLKELYIFSNEIEACQHPFICIDKADRERWVLLEHNAAFAGGLQLFQATINIQQVECSNGEKRPALWLTTEDSNYGIGYLKLHQRMNHIL
jgi:hypothetical protein